MPEDRHLTCKAPPLYNYTKLVNGLTNYNFGWLEAYTVGVRTLHLTVTRHQPRATDRSLIIPPRQAHIIVEQEVLVWVVTQNKHT